MADTTRGLKRPASCACVNPDAERCLELRTHGNSPAGEPGELREACECSCHDADQDGFDEWGVHHSQGEDEWLN